MNKRVICVFSLLLLCALTLGACGKKVDPFDDPSKSIEEFYSLSVKEAVGKYGMLPSFAGFCSNDGTYYYTVSDYKYLIGGTLEQRVSTVYKTAIRGNNEGAPACGDPLCKHTPDSGCVFVNADRCMFGSGSLFFTTKEIDNENGGKDVYTLYRYNEMTNTREKVDESHAVINLHSVHDVLYYSKMHADQDLFDNTVEYYTVSENGSARQFAVVDITYRGIPYKERVTIYSRMKSADSSSYLLCIYDIAAGKETVIDETKGTQPTLYGLYGSKLLLFDEKTNVWYYFDLDTFERTEFVSADDITRLVWTDRCVVIAGKRTKASDPYEIKIVFPETGETEVYDLNSFTDEPIDLNVSFVFTAGAVSLWKNDDIFNGGWICEIDLLSGRTRQIENSDGE